jgi:hypothetical protein
MPPGRHGARQSNAHSYGHPRATMRKLGSVAYLGPRRVTVAPHNLNGLA